MPLLLAAIDILGQQPDRKYFFRRRLQLLDPRWPGLFQFSGSAVQVVEARLQVAPFDTLFLCDPGLSVVPLQGLDVRENLLRRPACGALYGLTFVFAAERISTVCQSRTSRPLGPESPGQQPGRGQQ